MRSHRLIRSGLALCGLALSVALLSGCEGKLADLVDIGKDEEIQIGNRLTAGTLSTFGGECDDPETQLVITRIGKAIAEKCDRPDMPWEFYYVNDATVNAFALIGGHVFVTRGLTELLRGADGKVDVDMLAGVMGHEISHVVARHGARAIAEARWSDIAEAALDLMTKRDITADDAAKLSRAVLLRGYSRDHEEQADHLGAIYAARAGYAKDGLRRAMDLLKKLEGRYPDSTPWYLRTHPYASERTAALDQLLPTLDDDTISRVAYKVEEKSSGWWGLMNLGAQYVRAKFILKDGGQIQLVDSDNDGVPDTVVRVDGAQTTYYAVAGGDRKGAWRVAVALGNDGKPDFKRIAGYSPSDAEGFKQQAAQLIAAGKWSDAVWKLQAAINLGDLDPATRLQLAQAYGKVGNAAAARIAARSVLRTQYEGQAVASARDIGGGTPAPPAKAAARRPADNVASSPGVRTGAQPFDFGALAAVPPDAPPWVSRWLDCFAKGNVDGAIMEASNAIRQAPREAPGYLFRSIAYAQKGTFDNALADLDKCDELNPTALIATSLVRGFVYIAMGQKARAIDALQRFLDLARQAGVPEQATAVARQALDELRAGK